MLSTLCSQRAAAAGAPVAAGPLPGWAWDIPRMYLHFKVSAGRQQKPAASKWDLPLTPHQPGHGSSMQDLIVTKKEVQGLYDAAVAGNAVSADKNTWPGSQLYEEL
jgi:hypothetical protein